MRRGNRSSSRRYVKSRRSPLRRSRYHKTSRIIMKGCNDRIRTYEEPAEPAQEHLVFLEKLLSKGTRRKKYTHAERRSRAIQEKKMKIKVKEERRRAKKEHNRRAALMQAEENVLRAQLEIDDYKARYRKHEVFTFSPAPFEECRAYVSRLETLKRNSVMNQLKQHRQTPSAFTRLRQRQNMFSLKEEGLNEKAPRKAPSSSKTGSRLILALAKAANGQMTVDSAQSLMDELVGNEFDINTFCLMPAAQKESGHGFRIVEGHTPLMIVSAMTDSTLATTLVRYGANIDYICHNDGLSALLIAIVHRSVAVVKMLCQEAKVQGVIDMVLNPAGASLDPVDCALSVLEPDILRLLIQSGANVKMDKSPYLMKAIGLGSCEMTRILLEAGCSLLAQTMPCHMDELGIAALSGRFDIVQLLFKFHPDMCAERAERLYGGTTTILPRSEVSAHLPSSPESIFNAHPIIRQVFGFQLEDAMSYAGSVSRMVTRNVKGFTMVSPSLESQYVEKPDTNTDMSSNGLAVNSSTSAEDGKFGKTSSTFLPKLKVNTSKSSLKMSNFAHAKSKGSDNDHQTARERRAYNSFVAHELQVNDIFAHWLSQQKYSGTSGRIQGLGNSTSEQVSSSVKQQSSDVQFSLQDRFTNDAGNQSPSAASDSSQSLSHHSEKPANVKHQKNHSDHRVVRPGQDHFLVQRYGIYFDDIVQLLLWQLYEQCEVYSMQNNLHNYALSQLRLHGNLQPSNLQSNGKDNLDWATSQVKAEPFGHWFRRHFALFSSIIQRFGRPVISTKHTTVAQMLRSVSSRYSEDTTQALTSIGGEANIAAAAAANKAAKLSKHHDHDTQERLLFAVAQDEPTEVMVQVLGFQASVDLTLGTVFSRSQFINPIVDHHAQSLIRQHSKTSMIAFAVHCGSIRVLEALLLLKANVNAADEHGVTPLMLSVYRSDTIGARMLSTILKHASHTVDFYAETAPTALCGGVSVFYIAAQQSRFAALKALVQATHSQEEHERMVKEQRIRASSSHTFNSDDPISKRLRLHLNSPVLDNTTILLQAVYQGDVSVVQYLLSIGCRIDGSTMDRTLSNFSSEDEDNLNQTPRSNNNNGGDDGQQQSLVLFNGLTAPKAPALDIAVRRKHKAVIKCLIRSGASVNVTFGNNRTLCDQPITVLMMAVIHGDLDTVKSYIDLGADASWSPRADGMTAAHFAVMLFDLKLLNFFYFHPKSSVSESMKKRTRDGEDCNDLMKRWYHVKLRHALTMNPESLISWNNEALRKKTQRAWCKNCPSGRLTSLVQMRNILTSMELHLHFPKDHEMQKFATLILCRTDVHRDGIIGIKQFMKIFDHLCMVEGLYEAVVNKGLLVPDLFI